MSNAIYPEVIMQIIFYRYQGKQMNPFTSKVRYGQKNYLKPKQLGTQTQRSKNMYIFFDKMNI